MRFTIRTRSHRGLTLALAIAASSIAVVGTSASPVAADTNCTTSSDNDSTWYRGPSASYRFDSLFAKGPEVGSTVLDSRIPQGLTTWHNWKGTTDDLILYTAYRDGNETWVQGVNPKDGTRTKIVRVAASHAGGIAIVGKWLYISGTGANGTATVRKYQLSSFRTAFQSSATRPYVSYETSYSVYGNAFLASNGSNLFAGRFNKDGRSWMKRYAVAANGTLRATKTYRVPKKTQGLVVTNGYFVFSTSWRAHNRSNIYIVKRGSSLDSAGTSCFRAPSMSEGLALWGGKVFVIYESGSYKYNDDPCNWLFEKDCTRNIIDHLHKVPLSDLKNLLP